ncbi:hypothetical protein J4Q44_G00203930 [Coregonus suidteri]|uniref:Uncharacterized protein n=1 Tax=Coregonus suidteri TaxID=861788 RepID=A0AAN8QMF2_9TELE
MVTPRALTPMKLHEIEPCPLPLSPPLFTRTFHSAPGHGTALFQLHCQKETLRKAESELDSMVPEGLDELGWRGWGRRDSLGVEAREPEREEQPEDANMPPKFKRHLNDEEVTGSIRSERRNLLEEDSDEEEDFFLRGPTGPRFGAGNDKIRQ